MNAKPYWALAGALFLAALVGLTPLPSSGQAGGDEAGVLALSNEVIAQQTTILENQAAYDVKLAAIAENLRIARIYVGRGGGKTK